jgi:hypothetical protein
MKQIITYILALSLFVACDSENANDCFQTSGRIISQEIVVDSFSRVLVNRDITLILKTGDTQSVVVETGANLLKDVEVEVVGDRLVLTDNNTCNFTRDFGITKVYVTSPNLTEIRSSTQFEITSDGVLTFPNLTLLSEDFGAPDTFTVADFRLQVNNNALRVVFNNISNCFITGQTERLNINYASGSSRFEGRDLVAQDITIFHRSSNDMILNPQASIQGAIVSTGDVILVTTPPVVNVERRFTGRLIAN